MNMQTNKKNNAKYLICATPRVGSHLLFDLLESAGIAAGGDWERMHPRRLKEIKIDWEKQDLREFIGGLLKSGETPDGISGLKVDMSYLECLVCILNGTERYKGISVFDIKSYFPSDVKYVYLERRDKIRQGISQDKSRQSGIWVVQKNDKVESAVPLYFDYRRITDSVGMIKKEGKNWERFFRVTGISPLRIEYEELIKDHRKAIVRIFEYLGIPLPATVEIKIDTVKQSDALSEEWCRRYYWMRLWLGPWYGALRHSYQISAHLKKYCPFYGRFIKTLKNGKRKLMSWYRRLKCRIEQKRGSMNILWKFLVRAKDFLWKTQFALTQIFGRFWGILRTKPKNKMKYVYRRFRYYDVPMWKNMEIELNSFCNRDCAWCPRYTDKSGIRKDSNGNKVRKIMSTEKVYDLIDQAARLGFKGGIGFHRLSDGMLDPRFLEAWKYARTKGIRLFEATNGDVLRGNPELCAELDEQGNQIVIGIYDCDTDTEKEKEISLWKNRFSKAEIRFSEPLRKNLSLRQNALLYELAAKDPEEVDRPCVSQDEILLIRYDGNVSFCCQDDQCTFNLGNVFEQSIEEVWWSDRRAKIRRVLRQPGGRRQFDLCRSCYAQQRINDKERLSFIARWVKQHG